MLSIAPIETKKIRVRLVARRDRNQGGNHENKKRLQQLRKSARNAVKEKNGLEHQVWGPRKLLFLDRIF
jgi:hypothetical protein